MSDPTHQPRRSKRRRVAPGFSFTEVLFAVMILGIGFIMIAAIFPVSLSQVNSNNTETTGASVARSATNYLESVSNSTAGRSVFQVTLPSGTLSTPPSLPTGADELTLYGETWSMRDSRMAPDHRAIAWGAVAGNAIIPTDPRMAWIAAYRRDITYRRLGPTGGVIGEPAKYAQVIVAAVQSRNRPTFVRELDIEPTPPSLPINLNFREGLVDKWIAANPTAATPTLGSIEFDMKGANPAADAAQEGSYVIVTDYPNPDPALRNWMSGRVFRLGTRDAGNPNKYDMVPGAEFVRDPGPDRVINATDITTMNGVRVLVVGKGYENGVLEGPPMDISVYTTFVRVR